MLIKQVTFENRHNVMVELSENKIHQPVEKYSKLSTIGEKPSFHVAELVEILHE